MRLLLCLAALLLAGCAPPSWDPNDRPPGSDDSDNPFIHQSGTRLVDGAGNPVTLRAMNLGGWLLWEGWIWGGSIQPEQTILEKLRLLVGDDRTAQFAQSVHDSFVTDADLARIAALGLNAVRVPFNYRLLDDDAGWATLDRVIADCEAHGLVAILDLHSAPGGQAPYFMQDPGPTSLWTSQEAQDQTVALWKAIAARYRDRAGVGGYDLLNEPQPPEGELLFTLYRRIAAAIREVDRNHLILVEGANYAGDFSLFRAPVTFNQAYSFHQYVWLGDSRQEELDRYRALSELHQIPIWNGEFGVNSAEVIASTRRLYEAPANGLSGFAYWTWKEVPRDQPHLIGISAELPNWRKVISWVAGPPFATRPTATEAEAGLAEFIAALPLDQCDENAELVGALVDPP